MLVDEVIDLSDLVLIPRRAQVPRRYALATSRNCPSARELVELAASPR